MKIIAVSEGRKLAENENDRIRQNSRTSGSGAMRKTTDPFVIPKRGLLREESAASLLSASRFLADRVGFGVIILWGSSNYITTPHRAHYDPG
jgi:hypothetical protein